MTELPTTFGKYFLTEKLATGGMAEIYLGKLVGPGGFEKQLVIKQIHPKLTGQRHFVDLFVAEAKTLVTLAHGNIVPVYELGVIEDTYFIAMEYIDGPTLYRLTERLAQRDELMDPAVAAWVTARILEGLDYAHRKGEGVIHRDLSPRNVMLSRDGEVKLVDFGIAVTLGAPGEGEVAQAPPTGSFPYMSPEQVRREPLTGQTDLFSVGVLLWEMLVGARLFARLDPDETLAAVTTGEIPRPSSERPEIPSKLDDVVMRALERDKTARWATAGDMLDALQRYLYALEETPGPRDVAAMVALYCPPEHRRMPTHVEPDAGNVDPTPAPAGPHTAVIARDAKPTGRKRPRQQTFATHVELLELLDRATPATEDADDTSQTNIEALESKAPPVDDNDRRMPRVPSGLLFLLGALAALGLSGMAIMVFLRGKAAVMAPDAGIRLDAPFYAIFGEAGLDAPELDAAAPADAAVDAGRAQHDAAIHPHDAGELVPVSVDARVAVDARSMGTATLRIGATPWGDIVIDGAARGHTPKDVDVSAGHHTVEITCRVEVCGIDPPKKEIRQVDVKAGEVFPVQAEFQH
jgi:tRNA A-37 threonylcarbamoyl transferase component Bud32